VIDWATARGYRTGENPARWRGHLQNLLPARSRVRRVQHHPALSYEEIGAFMAELREQEGTAARALEFVILTATRTSETIRATWSEIEEPPGRFLATGPKVPRPSRATVERRSFNP